MKKTVITFETHYAMYNAMANFIKEHTNLDDTTSALMAGEMLSDLCEKANISFEPTEEDLDKLAKMMANVLADTLLS